MGGGNAASAAEMRERYLAQFAESRLAPEVQKLIGCDTKAGFGVQFARKSL